jgi:tetratricopeptide (TPR) repeat protein
MTSHDSAQTIVRQAQNMYKSGQYPRAADLFRSAADEYANQGDELTAAEMMNNCSVALLKGNDAAGALRAASGTDQTFAAANDAHRQALALGNQAAASEAMGDVQRALRLYRQSADLLKDTGDPELRAYVLSSLSALQLKNGDQLQSLATMQAALDAKPKLSLKERFLKKLIQAPFRMIK